MTARLGGETTLGGMARMRGCSHVDARVHVHVQVTFLDSQVGCFTLKRVYGLGMAWHGRQAGHNLEEVCVGGWG